MSVKKQLTQINKRTVLVTVRFFQFIKYNGAYSDYAYDISLREIL